MRAFVLFVLLAACGASQSVGDASTRERERARRLDRFLADEDHVLSLDRGGRCAHRAARNHAGPRDASSRRDGGVLAEDQTMDMEGDRPDVFSFDVRARALDAAMAIVRQVEGAAGIRRAFARRSRELGSFCSDRLVAEKSAAREASGTCRAARAFCWARSRRRGAAGRERRGKRTTIGSRGESAKSRIAPPQSLTLDRARRSRRRARSARARDGGNAEEQRGARRLRLAVQRVVCAASRDGGTRSRRASRSTTA